MVLSNLAKFGVSSLRGKWLHFGIAFSAGSAFLLFGYDQGVVGGLITDESFLAALGNPTSSFLGVIVALYNVGCLAGCVVAGMWGNRLGRKRTVIYGSIIMLVGGTLQAAIYEAVQMIIGRIVSGVGTGMITSTIPVYVAECSPAKNRGRSVATQSSIVIFGTVVAYWLDYGTITNLTGEVVWRFPIAFQNIFALITLATLPFLPETPRWLFSNGYQAEAITVLARLADTTTDDHRVKAIEEELRQSLADEQEASQFSFRDIIKDKSEIKNTRRLLICFATQFWQQFTGINVIAFYVMIVLQTNLGMEQKTASLVAGCIQIAFWVATVPLIFLIDRFGRRPTFILGSLALLISMSCFTAGIAVNTSASANMALGFLFLFEMSFGMSWNATPWLYAPEITTLRMRHIGAATATFSEWLWTFVIALITPYAIENAGWKFYLLFVVMIFLAIPFVYFVFPETSGKTLEEIDYIFCKITPFNEEGINHTPSSEEEKGEPIADAICNENSETSPSKTVS